MDTEYDQSRIEKKKRGLYSPDGPAGGGRHSELSPSSIDVSDNWDDAQIMHEHEKPHNPFGIKALKMLVVLAVLTTFASGGFLLYEFFNPFARASDKNIDIAIDMPTSVNPGSPSDIDVRVSNQNRTSLEGAVITLVFPSGTKDSADPTKDLRQAKKIIGTLAAGAVAEFRTKAVFLGAENSDVEVKANLDYSFANINSSFTKTESRPIHMLASPVNLTVDALKNVNSGQPVELDLKATSNTLIPLQNVLVEMTYPIGFTFTDADPKPTFGNNVWRIGALDSTEHFDIKVHGTMNGNANEEKVFYSTVGAGVDQSARSISAEYSKVLTSMTLERPFIGIALGFNDRSASEAIVHINERARGTIDWSNNLPNSKIVNAQIEIHLSGIGLDKSSVVAGHGGYYDSRNDTITWDYRGDNALRELQSGDQGSESFSFLPLATTAQGDIIPNPTVKADVTVKGQRISESGVPEEISQFLSQDVKVSSQAQFASRAVFYGSHIVNSGPLPPEVNKETTYTAIWSIVNTSNALTNVQVHAILPPGVEWGGSVYPGSDNIIYNPITHDITWSPGGIPSGTGVGNKPPREVEFQVVLTPSLTQVSQDVPLVTNTTFSGKDSFTGEEINIRKNDLTTVLSTDPLAPAGSGIVQQ